MNNLSFSQRTDAVKLHGGNAVPGVSRINQANVHDTYRSFLNIIAPMLCINECNIKMIGSAGKKHPASTSGDIDIAVKITKWHNHLKLNNYDFYIDCLKRGGYAHADMRQIGIISFAYPIANTDMSQSNQCVQIDLMLVDSLEYAVWGFYSPHYIESEYKGLYRNELNFFIAKHAAYQPLLTLDGIDVEWSRYWFSTRDGLCHGTQTCLSQKTGRVIKTPTILSKSLFSNDPDVVAKFLYGNHVDATEILTFEDALRQLNSSTFPYKKQRDSILKDTIRGIRDKGYPVPDILLNMPL